MAEEKNFNISDDNIIDKQSGNPDPIKFVRLDRTKTTKAYDKKIKDLMARRINVFRKGYKASNG